MSESMDESLSQRCSMVLLDQMNLISELKKELEFKNQIIDRLMLETNTTRELCTSTTEWAKHLYEKTSSYYEFFLPQYTEEHLRLINNIQCWLEVLKYLV